MVRCTVYLFELDSYSEHRSYTYMHSQELSSYFDSHCGYNLPFIPVFTALTWCTLSANCSTI